VSTGLFEWLQRELEEQEKAEGLTMTEILTMPDPLRQLVNWMLRQQSVDFTEIAAFVGEDEATSHAMLETLIERGIVQQVVNDDVARYHVRMASRRGRQIPLDIWQALEEKIREDGEKER